MASGHVCLNLSSQVEWSTFPEYAQSFLKKINGQLIDITDSADTRLWKVRIHGREFRFVYDDYPSLVTLESVSDQGDVVARDLFSTISASKRSPDRT